MTADTSQNARCEKCGQEVVRAEGARFWLLLTEQGTGQATMCPEGGVHRVEDDSPDG